MIIQVNFIDIYGRKLKSKCIPLQNLDININGQTKKYELHYIIEHIGSNYNSGHYISYFKKNNTWYCANDTIITRIETQQLPTQPYNNVDNTFNHLDNNLDYTHNNLDYNYNNLDDTYYYMDNNNNMDNKINMGPKTNSQKIWGVYPFKIWEICSPRVREKETLNITDLLMKKVFSLKKKFQFKTYIVKTYTMYSIHIL